LLQVTNDLTAATEVGALFLDPNYRRDRMGKLMSLSRFMFIAAFPRYFAETVIAEMRGVQDHEGNSPFYNALPRHFFDMPFHKADHVNATQGNQFINDLLPKYPIYVDILPKSAQRVIGQVHAGSEPARAMLERQGFKYTGYVDIFDAGATMVADRDQIHVGLASKHGVVAAIEELSEDTSKYMVSNDQFTTFRCAAGRLVVGEDGSLTITPRLAERANFTLGDRIRYYPL
jgi:arginine N-succinyltransferase